jgi:hypothetical protein
MIQIEGLNAFQMTVADSIWRLDTVDEVETWISKLPARSLRIQARVVFEMMVAAGLEEEDFEDLDLAKEAIDKICK